MAKTYIQQAIDKILKPYESSKTGFLMVKQNELENLKNQLYSIIRGNEEIYKDEIDERIAKIKANNIEIKIHESIPEKIKLEKHSIIGKTIRLKFALTAILATVTLCSCEKQPVDIIYEKPSETIELSHESNVEDEEIDIKEEINTNEEMVQNNNAEEFLLKQFSIKTSENTFLAINSLLTSGVKLIDNEIEENKQKELLASEWLQYYLVANIDEITTLEYANFMKEQAGIVLDNDDLIYNFRNMNSLLKGQMLVCTPENKIDFSYLYNDEFDAQLLNDGADILARFNNATKTKEKKKISKEFYEYIQNTILNQTGKLKYSNSAISTFINVEFSAWAEIAKSSKFGRGYYPDDELEAKLMSVISNCGMSNGEKTTLDITDETKTSLESINVIRVLESLNSRKENILYLSSLGQLYYFDEASFSKLLEIVEQSIDLSNYEEIESFTEKKEKEIAATKPQVNKNDSQVSNGQGGTIAKDDMESHGIDPTESGAKDKYEEAVKTETEKNEFKDNSGNVVDKDEAARLARQGAIDAINGANNINNVPEQYKSSYSTGWNEANKSIIEANKTNKEETTFQPTEEKVVETKEEIKQEDFKEDIKPENNNNSNNTFVPTPPQNDSDSLENEPQDNNSNIEQTTEFIPVDDGEVIIEEKEEITGFYSSQVESYKQLKNVLEQAMGNYQAAVDIYTEIEKNDKIM